MNKNKTKQDELISEIHYITSDNAVFAKTGGGFVSLNFMDETYDRVNFHLCFPFTDPDLFVSVREANDKAKEIGMIRDIKELPEATAEIIREQINLRYFTPVIEKITNLKEEYGYGYFDVVTDRGPVRFAIYMNAGAIASLSSTRILITDIDGNRFEIPDINRLSVSEQRKLEIYI